MRAGARDRQVELQQRTLTQSPSGEKVESWATLGRLWAGKRDVRAGERWAAQQLLAEIETVWTLNWWPAWETIRPDTHRLVYRDRIYEIHGLREIGRHEGIEIAAAARGETLQSVPQAPSASNVAIAGDFYIGQALTASYDYHDRLGLPEKGTTFQWYRADDESGTNAEAIAGATSINYTLQEADLHQYLRVEVTPSDGVQGEPTVSQWAGQIWKLRYQSNFAAGIDSFSAQPPGSTVTAPVDGVGPSNDLRDTCLRYTKGADNGHCFMRRAGIFSQGKTYRIICAVFVPVQSVIKGFHLVVGSSPIVIFDGHGLNGTWVDVDTVVTVSSVGDGGFQCMARRDADNYNISGAIGQRMFIRDITILE